jgi:hypothetical protein
VKRFDEHERVNNCARRVPRPDGSSLPGQGTWQAQNVTENIYLAEGKKMYVGAEDLKWEEHIVTKYQEYFDLTYSFLKSAEDLQDEFVKKKIDSGRLGAEGSVLSFLFAKSYKTTRASLLLCKSGYSEDALILARVNFEAALWALYIFKEKRDAEEKAIAFIKYDAIERKEKLSKLLREYEDEGEFKAKLKETLKQIEKELPKTDSECRMICRIAGKKTFDLAKDVKLLHLLYRGFYRESSSYVHSRIGSSPSYVTESNGHVRFSVAPSEKGTKDVLIYLCLFLWYVMEKFNLQFGLKSEEILNEDWAKLNEVCKNIN